MGRSRALSRPLIHGVIAPGGCGGISVTADVPMATGLKLLNAGKISKHGVFDPEMVIAPDDLFDELGACCSVPAPMKFAKVMLLIS